MWDEVEESEATIEPQNKRKQNGCFVFISLALVITLLGSSIGGAVWFFRLRDSTPVTPEVIVREVVVEVTATPLPAEEDSLDAASLSSTIASPLEHNVNRIVFINGNGRIGTIAPNGEDGRLLTSESDREYLFPAWSPDGQYLAAIGSDQTTTAIDILMDTADSTPQQIYSDRTEVPFYLYWSPDGEAISFLANHPDDGMALHVVSTIAESDSHIVSTGGPFYWEWTADGEQLLIHTGFAGRSSRLTFVDKDGDGDGENIAQPGFFQTPGISVNGRYLAYAAATEEADGSEIVIVDTTSDAEQHQRHQGLAALGWSPTSDELAFISSADPEGNNFAGPLRLLDAQTGEERLLSRETVLAFFWSPNGRYIAYLSFGQNDSEINAKANNGHAKPSHQFQLPMFNLSVIDVATGEGQQLLTDFQPTTLFLTRFLPFFDQYSLSHQVWSPDSSELVLPMNENGREHIVVMPINGGQARTIADGSLAFWSRQ